MHKLTNFLTIGGLVGATVVSGAALSASTNSAAALETKTSKASVTVSASCSMTATLNTEHKATLPTGTYSVNYETGGTKPYENGIGKTTINTFCNDPSGYAIYAIGYTNDTNGETALKNSVLGSDSDIATGTATSGSTSNWAMKVSASAAGDGAQITNNFDNYSSVPENYMKVAGLTKATEDDTVGSEITTTYAAYISGEQAAGTYSGKVKYVLVHPFSGDASDADTMQNVANWGTSIAVGQEVSVQDERDGQEYTVGRICTEYDGEDCKASELWMTQNLDFKIDPLTPLTSENTNLTTSTNTSGATLDGYSEENGVITWTPSSTLATPATINNTSVSGWTSDNYKPYQAEGTQSNEDIYVYNGTRYNSLATCISAGHTQAECTHYKVGNYYNFSAATAMNDSSKYTSNYTKMPNSICPAGWRLPNGPTSSSSTVSEFGTMLAAQGVWSGSSSSYATDGFTRINTTGIHGDPLYFVRSGIVDGSSLSSMASVGLYWSSAVSSSNFGFNLGFDSGSVDPQNGNDRYFGFSVRCVAE